MMKIIKIFKVTGVDDLSIEEQDDLANEHFTPLFVHIKNDDGTWYLAVITKSLPDNYKEISTKSKEYSEMVTSIMEMEAGLFMDVSIDDMTMQ